MNKLFVIFILTVTLAQCQSSDALDTIIHLKNNVSSLCNDLELYNNNFTLNQKSELNGFKRAQMWTMTTALQNARKATTNDVMSVFDYRNHAEACSEQMDVEFNDIQKIAYAQLEKCVNDQLMQFNAVKDSIDECIKNGKLLLSELDGIAARCGSNNQTQADLCEVQQSAAHSSVDRYEEMIKQLKSTADSFSKSVSASVARCFEQPIDNFYSVILAARTSASNCIQNPRFHLFQ